MAERLRANRGLSYPADEASLKIARDAGGLSKLPADTTVAVKRVEAGEWCDDLPDDVRALYLERGYIEVVQVDELRAAAKAKAKR